MIAYKVNLLRYEFCVKVDLILEHKLNLSKDQRVTRPIVS
jgi:hypothetical protein